MNGGKQLPPLSTGIAERCSGRHVRWYHRINRPNHDVDYSSAIPLTDTAGSITIHHVRAVHGSASNLSDKDCRLLLFQFRAADAWPLFGFPAGIGTFNALMVASIPCEPRLEKVPVRLPPPPATLQGSLHGN